MTNFLKEKEPIKHNICLYQEGPGGIIGFYVNLDENSQINRLKIHTPSFHHAQFFEKLIIGLDIEDALIVQGSLNFSVGEIER